jgi:sugar phosphate isomerase/epimerase
MDARSASVFFMPYKVGISSGWWSIARDPNLLGLAQKAGGFGATGGVQFNQVDLDTILEFIEPDAKQRFKRTVKELGLEIGLHAEIGEFIALESGERKIWELSHERLCQTVKYAVDFEMKYVNIHVSNQIQLQQREQQIRPFGYQYEVVSYDGKPLWTLCEKSPAAKAEALKHMSPTTSADREKLAAKKRELAAKGEARFQKEMGEFRKASRAAAEQEADSHGIRGPQREAYIQSKVAEYERVQAENLRIRIESDIEKELYSAETIYGLWKVSNFGKFFMEAGEIGANLIVAEHMRTTSDILWTVICRNWNVDEAYHGHPEEFNAALSAKYLEGHFLRKDHPANQRWLNGMSVLEWCAAKRMYLLLEMPHSQQGQEGLLRFFHPDHMLVLAKKLNNPYVKLTIDPEQTMAQNINFDEYVKKMPEDIGKFIQMFHLGEPVPYWGTAHIPIQLGSPGQEVLYRWLFEFRKRGFKDGIILFERGGGRGGKGGGATTFEVFEQSVLALRQIARCLDLGIKPDELPLDFYGISEQNEPVYKRQAVTVREHAWDPLEGVLSVPEEKHTFLSGAAVQKGKAQEWEKRKFR